MQFDFSQLDTKRVQNLRIVVSLALKLGPVHSYPLSVYKTQRIPEAYIDFLIGPAMAWSSAAIEIYLLPAGNETSWSKAKVAKILDGYFTEREVAMGALPTPSQSPGTCRPNYTIKGLDEYIEEGCEDELPPQELEFWRKRYAFLKAQGKRSVGSR
jgi:hypothetical protein